MLGFEVGMYAGSVASAHLLGAPDLTLLTLTELCDQTRRICRASFINLMVDADHGFGNALNVRRTVGELQAAGASAITLEDSALPVQFGANGALDLISVSEMAGKLLAAVDARSSPDLVIIGRTEALCQSLPEDQKLVDAVRRAKAYAESGADAIFLTGLTGMHQLETLRAAIDVPLVLGTPSIEMSNELLAEYGVRIVLRGHKVFNASVNAIYSVLKDQAEALGYEGAGHDLGSESVMASAIAVEEFERWRSAYLR